MVRFLGSIFGFMMLLCGAVCAQGTVKTQAGADDAAARNLLDKTVKWISGSKHWDIRFEACAATSQTLNDPASCIKGSMLLSGDNFRLNLGRQVYYCSGDDLWFYDAPAKEVSVYNRDRSTDALNPLAMLKNYKTRYRCKYIRQQTAEGSAKDIIDLTPLERGEVMKIRVFLNASDHRLFRMELYYSQDNIRVYKISECKAVAEPSAGEFVFPKEKYPSVEWIDMR